MYAAAQVSVLLFVPIQSASDIPYHTIPYHICIVVCCLFSVFCFCFSTPPPLGLANNDDDVDTTTDDVHGSERPHAMYEDGATAVCDYLPERHASVSLARECSTCRRTLDFRHFMLHMAAWQP